METEEERGREGVSVVRSGVKSKEAMISRFQGLEKKVERVSVSKEEEKERDEEGERKRRTI